MDKTLKGIVDLLSDERVERRCAAAMLLGDLKAKEPPVITALANTLTEENDVLRSYALDALIGMRAKKMAPYVSSLLDSTNPEIRQKAQTLLGNQGSRSATAMIRELQDAPAARRRKIVELLAKQHNKETFERLLDTLVDREMGDPVVNILRHEMLEMNATDENALRDVLLARVKDKTRQESAVELSQLLRLLGNFRQSRLVNALLPFTKTKYPAEVRLAALVALNKPLSVKHTSKQIEAVLAHADDPNPTIARTVVSTLRGLAIPADITARLLQLADGQHVETRSLAVKALGSSSDPKALKALLGHLETGDPNARDAAGRSLNKMEGIAGPLFKAMLQALPQKKSGTKGGAKGSVQRASGSGGDTYLERLLRLLSSRADELKPAQRKKLAESAVQALESEASSAEGLLRLLRKADPKRYSQVLTDRALAHRRGRRFGQAFSLLSKVDQAGLLEDDARYTCGLSGLCASDEKKSYGRASRTTDPVLKHWVALVQNGYPLAAKLKRERILSPEDYFFVGFNFSESHDEDEKEFGGELLAHLVKKSPRSKLGRSAKNKLRLGGLL